MSQDDQDLATGKAFRSLQEKRQRLSAVRCKALQVAIDLEIVADLMNPRRGSASVRKDSQEIEERSRAWKSAFSGEGGEGPTWPTLEDIASIYGEMDTLREDIDDLTERLGLE